MISQPYYMMNFSAALCLFEIRVNDVPILHMNLPGQVSSRIPINFAIWESGPQELEIKLLPILGESALHPEASFKYDIQSFDVENVMNFDRQFEGHEFQKIKKQQMIPVLVNKTLITLDVPYSIEKKWEDGLKIKDVKKMQDRLNIAYSEIAVTIRQSDYARFREILSAREAIMATSMYLNKKESDLRIDKLIYSFQNGYDDIRIAKDAVPVVSNYGKRVALKKPNGDAALTIRNNGENEQILLDIEFYFEKNLNQFLVI